MFEFDHYKYKYTISVVYGPIMQAFGLENPAKSPVGEYLYMYDTDTNRNRRHCTRGPLQEQSC